MCITKVCQSVMFFSQGDRVSEREQEAADSALPPANLQAAGGGDGRSRAGLPADESLQTHDQGRPVRPAARGQRRPVKTSTSIKDGTCRMCCVHSSL